MYILILFFLQFYKMCRRKLTRDISVTINKIKTSRRIEAIAERDVIEEPAALHYCFFYRVKII